MANDRVIDTVELYIIGILDKASALGKLAAHRVYCCEDFRDSECFFEGGS